jgi:hypothetical protein
MFDFTPLSKGVALVLLAYVAAWPTVVVVAVISLFAFQLSTLPGWVQWMNWPVPVVFPLASVVLVVDHFRRLTSDRMTVTEVTGYRAAGVMMALGSAFGLGTGHWECLAVSVAAFVLLLLPTHGKARPSTWTSS